MGRVNGHLLRELCLLRTLFSWHGEAEVGIVPTIIKVIVIIIVVVGGKGFNLKYCCRVGHDVRVLAPVFANSDQIGSGKALGVVGLRLGYELDRKSTRLNSSHQLI